VTSSGVAPAAQSAGKAPPCEHPLVTACREVTEETGIQARAGKRLDIEHYDTARPQGGGVLGDARPGQSFHTHHGGGPPGMDAAFPPGRALAPPNKLAPSACPARP